VDLDIGKVAVGVVPLEGVARVAVLVAVAVGGAAVAKEDHDLVDALGVLAEIVPEHVGVLEVRLGVALLGVDKVGKFGGVADEEDGGVVEDPVPVALLGAQLDGESAGVACGVCRARLAADGREAGGDGGLVADLAEEAGTADVRDVVRDLEDAVCTCPLGMDDALGDALAVKVGEQIEVVEVCARQMRSSARSQLTLQQQRTMWPHALCFVWLWVRRTVRRRVHRPV
jgi:hypothetical protein